MSILENLLLNQFTIFTLVLARISGLVMTAPIFGSQAVPMRVRAFLAVALSVLVTPLQVERSTAALGNLLDYVLIIGGELLVGVLLGVGVMIMFIGVQLAGQIISQLSGMGLADVFQPGLDTNVALFSQLLTQVTMAVFVLVGGHRIVMAALLDTFSAIPAGSGGPSGSVVEALTTIVSESFVLGIRAAAPAMTALLLTTLVLGFVSRTLPQINILAVGFGINSLVTFGALFLSIGAIALIFQEHIESFLDLLQTSLAIRAG